MQRQKTKTSSTIEINRWMAQQIRRKMITKVKPSAKIYNRKNGKKDNEY